MNWLLVVLKIIHQVALNIYFVEYALCILKNFVFFNFRKKNLSNLSLGCLER